MNRMISFAIVTLAAATAAQAQLHNTDFAMGVVDGQLRVGGIDAGGHPAWDSPIRSGIFGELPGLPNYTADPGFDSEVGTFEPGRWIGLDILQAVRVWDGQDFDAISPFPIRITEDGMSITSPATDTVVPGFEFAQANASGKVHEHVAYELRPDDQENAPENGVYLFMLGLWSVTPPALIDADPVWIVFGRGVDEEDIDAAVAWVEDNIVNGCPADLNGDGSLNGIDVGLFLSAYANQQPAADFNGDGLYNGLDVGLFLSAYSGGC